MTKHLLKMADLNQEEIIDILNLADQLKYDQKHGIPPPSAGRQNPRYDLPESIYPVPRVSFETGMYQLGGLAQFLSPPVTFRSAAANRFRILPAYSSPVTSTVL